jgi:hypothetical protein
MKYIKNRDSFKLILEKGEDGFYNDTLWDNSLVGRLFNWIGFKTKNQVKKGMFKAYLNDIEKALNSIIMENIKDDESVKVDNIYSTIYGIKKWVESKKEIDLQQLMIMIQESIDKLEGYKTDESYKNLIEDIDKILQKFEEFKDALINLYKTEFDVRLEMDKESLKRLDDEQKEYDNKIKELNDTLKDIKTGFQLASKSLDDLDRVFMDEPEKKKAFLSAYRTILSALGLSNRLYKSQDSPDTSSVDDINKNISTILKNTIKQGDKVEWISKKGNVVKGVVSEINTNGGKGIQISYDKDKIIDVTYTGASNNKTFKINGKPVSSLTESIFSINEAVATSITDSISAIQNFFDILKRLPQLKGWETELQNDIKKIIGIEMPKEPTRRETVDSEVVKKTVDKIVENIDFNEVLINEEKAKELIAKSEELSKQKNTEKTKEAAIDIVKVFNRISRLMLKNESYMERKPRMERYYTKVDGSTMWRNNELFENWNNGVLSILGKYGYKTNSKPIPKAVVDFIIDMLDDSRLINKGHQQAYLRKHFNISEDDAKKFTNYDKGGKYDTEDDDDESNKDVYRTTTSDKTLEYSDVQVLDITSKNFSKISFAVSGDMNAKSLTEGENSNIKRGVKPIVCYVIGTVPNTGHLAVKFKIDNKDFIERYVRADNKNITDEKFSNKKKDQIFFGFMPNKIKIKKDGKNFNIKYCRIEEMDTNNPNICELVISPKEVYILTGLSDGFMYNFNKKVDSNTLIDNDKIVKMDTSINNLWQKFRPKNENT